MKVRKSWRYGASESMLMFDQAILGPFVLLTNTHTNYKTLCSNICSSNLSRPYGLTTWPSIHEHLRWFICVQFKKLPRKYLVKLPFTKFTIQRIYKTNCYTSLYKIKSITTKIFLICFQLSIKILGEIRWKLNDNSVINNVKNNEMNLRKIIKLSSLCLCIYLPICVINYSYAIALESIRKCNPEIRKWNEIYNQIFQNMECHFFLAANYRNYSHGFIKSLKLFNALTTKKWLYFIVLK